MKCEPECFGLIMFPSIEAHSYLRHPTKVMYTEQTGGDLMYLHLYCVSCLRSDALQSQDDFKGLAEHKRELKSWRIVKTLQIIERYERALWNMFNSCFQFLNVRESDSERFTHTYTRANTNTNTFIHTMTHNRIGTKRKSIVWQTWQLFLLRNPTVETHHLSCVKPLLARTSEIYMSLFLCKYIIKNLNIFRPVHDIQMNLNESK